MPGIADLFRLISLDVTRGLVQQGLGLGFATVGGGAGSRFTNTPSTKGGPAPSPLAIVDASNTTPIVLTCAQPHGIPLLRATGYPNELHAVVSGVLGNTAANAIDATPPPAKSRTIGLNRGVHLVPVSATQFAMYVPSYSTGLLEPLAGNGAYTGGGTITPALTSGFIFVGREHTRFENMTGGAPPFLAVVPVGNEFANGARSVAHGAVGITAEQRNELRYRALGIDWLNVEVHAWGCANPPDPLVDFEITQRLYQQFLQSLHLLGCGSFRDKTGLWSDQQPKETQLVKLGHYHVITASISTPLLEFAMPFVPTPITPAPITYMSLQDGSLPEIGCS